MRSIQVRSVAAGVLVVLGALGVSACGPATEPVSIPAAPTARAPGSTPAPPIVLSAEELTELAVVEVRAIAKAAAAAFARDKALCAAAESVPYDVPRGGVPSPRKHSDFTGDPKSGWPCLGYIPKSPYFRYSYRVGKDYVMPELVSSESLEACAEADPTRGGTTMRVCWLGVVLSDGTVKLGSQYIVMSEAP